MIAGVSLFTENGTLLFTDYTQDEGYELQWA